MPNINAALGCAQLEQLPAKLAAKRQLFLKYQKTFKNVKGITLFEEPNNCISNYWLQTIVLDEFESENRNLILEATNESGIMTRPVWVLLNELEHFKNSPSMDLSTSRSLSGRIINIPSSPGIVLENHE
jgi:perosamine synthetase